MAKKNEQIDLVHMSEIEFLNLTDELAKVDADKKEIIKEAKAEVVANDEVKELTYDNYFDKEFDMQYMSNSQFKDFMKCEAKAMAKINGELKEEKSEALLLGGYLDAVIQGEEAVEKYKKKTPELFTQKGELYSKYKTGASALDRVLEDSFFAGFLEGEKQEIVTGEIGGVEFKGAIDVLNLGANRIVDFKTTGAFKKYWNNEMRVYQNNIWAWRYDIQLAIYQELERQKTGKLLDCYIAIMETSAIPDYQVIKIEQGVLDSALAQVTALAGDYQIIKLGIAEPIRCEKCDYCKQTKRLDHVVNLLDLDAEMNETAEDDYEEEE